MKRPPRAIMSVQGDYLIPYAKRTGSDLKRNQPSSLMEGPAGQEQSGMVAFTALLQ